MNMQEQIAHMIEQFSWEPVLERGESLSGSPSTIVVCGMGGSHLAAQLLAREVQTPQFIIHHDYGLPQFLTRVVKENTLVLISSYSGETEETLSAFDAALAAELPMASMTSGGTLLARSRGADIPTVVLPHEDIEPRMTLGYMLRGLASIIKDETLSGTMASVKDSVTGDQTKGAGNTLAEALGEKIPVLYASTHNASLAYILKATFNETAKIPAFWDIVPEACHNELSGYDFGAPFAATANILHPIFITDNGDHPRVQLRMELMQKLLKERGIETSTIETSHNISSLAAGVQVINTGTWAAVVLASKYGVQNAKTPIISALKEQLSNTP